LTQVKARRGSARFTVRIGPNPSDDPDMETTKPTNLPVVYACSGCSDAGELADRIARKLSAEGHARMSCLAGVGGRVKPLLRTAQTAERVIVIDGCPLNCARHTLQLAGIEKFEHLALQDIGLRKGDCPVTDERIALGVEAAKEMLNSEAPAPAAS
jgi:uncharacterized metal-binding protein